MNEYARPCPSCIPGSDPEFLTREMIVKRLEGTPIDPALAAEDAVYKSRLQICDECVALNGQVLCAYCGCFVMFRARPKKSRCPHPDGDKWAISGPLTGAQ